MKFVIEQVFLTNKSGHVVPIGSVVDSHFGNAPDVDAMIEKFVGADGAELLGQIFHFPGFHGIATARRGELLYTLNVRPVTNQIELVADGKTDDSRSDAPTMEVKLPVTES